MAINIRPLQPGDCNFLYTWRHAPDTVQWSLSPPPTWEGHLRHFEQLLYEEDWKTFIAEICMPDEIWLPVGVLRLEDGEISIMVSELHRRQGVGRALIKAAQARCMTPLLMAKVKYHNSAAVRLFSSCGFIYFNHDNDGQTYVWTKEDE